MTDHTFTPSRTALWSRFALAMACATILAGASAISRSSASSATRLASTPVTTDSRGPAVHALAPTASARPATHGPKLAAARTRPQPLYFEPNRGQAPDGVLFVSRGRGYDLRLDRRGASLTLSRGQTRRTVRLALAGSSLPRAVAPDRPLAARVHYLLGRDQRRWIRDVPTYGRVRYSGVYPGIDMVFYGNEHRLEYDFLVAAEADPSKIRLGFRGADRLQLDPGGQLLVHIGGRELEQAAPVVYQHINGARVSVPAHYRLADASHVAIALGAYDRSQPLVIDPLVLGWSTYLGGEGTDKIEASAVNSKGELVVVGSTEEEGSWIFTGSDQGSLGSQDAFVSRFDAEGRLLSTTFVGGGGNDVASAVAIDPQDNIYITGTTTSLTFPTTANAAMPESESLQVSLKAGIPFLDLIKAPDFGTGAVGDADAFVTKLDPSGRAAKYSSYLGGSPDVGLKLSFDPLSEKMLKLEFDGNPGIDTGEGIAVDATGNAYVVGTTDSEAFPVTPGAIKSSLNAFLGASDGFITKIDTNGSGVSSIKFSSYLGGSCDDEATGVAVDNLGEVFVTGDSAISFVCVGFTTTDNAPHKDRIGDQDAFVLGLLLGDHPGVVFSTFIGTTQIDHGGRVGVDPFHHIYASYVANDDVGGGGTLHVAELSQENTGKVTEGWDVAVGATTRSSDPLTFRQPFPHDLFTPGPNLPLPVFAVANAGGPNLYQLTDSGGHFDFHGLGLGGAATIAESVTADARRVFVSGGTTSDSLGVFDPAQATRKGGVEAFTVGYTYNPPPKVTGLALTGVLEGQTVEGNVATFPVTTGVADSFFDETIDWGDGGPLSLWKAAAVQVFGTSASVSGAHAYGRPGTYTGTACVNQVGSTDEPQCAPFTVQVTNVAPTTTVDPAITPSTPGTVFDGSGSGITVHVGTIASFTDPGFAESHSATVTWQPGGEMDTAEVSQSGSRGNVINVSHTFSPSDRQNRSATVCVIDEAGASSCATTEITLPMADLQVTSNGPSSAAACSVIDYDIKVTNNGPSTAQNVVIKHTLQHGMRYASTLLLGGDGDGTVENESRLPGSGDGTVLGVAAAMDRTTAVVTSEEAALVYERDPLTFQWNESARVTTLAMDAAAMQGDWMVLARKGFNTSPTDHTAGYAEVYHRVNAQWTLTQTLTPPATDVAFGAAVAVGGTTLVVGDPGINNGAGAAYLYRYDGSTWTYGATFPGNTTDQRMGQSVAVSQDGNSIAIGEPGDRGFLGSGTTDGTVNLLHFDEFGAASQTKLTPGNQTISGPQEFGASVAFDESLDAPRLAVGAPQTTNGVGAAYVFDVSNPQNVARLAELRPNDGGLGEQFGRSIDISDNRVLVGTGPGFGEGPDSASQNRAYLFSPITSTTTWDQVARFMPAGGKLGDKFGNAVAISDGAIIIGAPGGNNAYATVYSSCLQPTGDGSVQCDIGSLAPGQSAEFLLSATLGPGTGHNAIVSATGEVFSGALDTNVANNSATTTTQISGACEPHLEAPTVTPVINGQQGQNGWYRGGPVKVTWNVLDLTTAITSKAGCDPTTISNDTNGTTLTCSATSAGGTTSRSVTIKLDTQPPIITQTGPPTMNSEGGLVFPLSCQDPVVNGVSSGMSACTGQDNPTEGSLEVSSVSGLADAFDAAGNRGILRFGIPTADAGAPQTIDAPPGACAVPVSLHGSGIDPVGGALAYLWSENGNPIAHTAQPTLSLAAGVHVLSLVVTAVDGVTASSATTVTVRDSNPPIFSNVPLPIITDATGLLTQVNVPMPTATACGPVQVTSDAPAGGFLAGDTNVFFTATEAGGQTATAVTRVTVRPLVDVGVSIPAATLIPGQTGTIAFNVENKGPSRASNITVTPSFPEGIAPTLIDAQTCTADASGQQTCTPIQAYSAEALCVNGTNGLSCLIPSLDPGEQTSFTLHFALPGDAPGGPQTVRVTALNTENDADTSDNLASGTVMVAGQSDLALGLVAPPAVVAGTDLAYTLTLTNLGPSIAPDSVVTQTLPAGVAFKMGAGCSSTGGVLTCAGGRLPVGGTIAFPVTLTVGSGSRGSLALTALAASTEIDPVAGNNQPTASVAIGTQVNVSASVTPIGGLTAGQPGTLLATIANAGPSDATHVMIQLGGLSAGARLTMAPPGCTLAADGTGSICQIDRIPAGATGAALAFSVSIDPFARGSLTASTTVADAEEVTSHLVPLNARMAANTDLSVVLTAPAGPATAGTALDYTATVTNAGPSGSTGATLALPLAAGSTLAASTGCTVLSGVVSCGVGRIAPGGQATVTIPVQIDPFARNTFTQSARVASGSADEADTNATNDTTSLSTPIVASADLLVIADTLPNPVTAGSTLTYAVTVTNAGPSGVTAPVLTQMLPIGVHVQAAPAGCTTSGDATSGETLTCSLAQLAPHASAPLTVLTQTDGGLRGMLASVAKVSAAEADPDLTNNTSTASTPIVTSADLTITLTAAPSPAMSGSLLRYHVHVTNAGPSSATGVTIADQLPKGIGLPSALLPTGCTPSGGTLTCAISDLASGAVADLDVAMRPTAAGLLANTVTVTATEPDPNPADNTASLAVNVTGQSGGLVGSADFNGDGALDIAVGDADGDSVHIWLNDGAGNFVDAQTVRLMQDHDGHWRGDSDGDGDDDDHGHTPNDDAFGWWEHGHHGLPPGLAVGDFNGDGSVDIAVANWRTTAVDVLTNDGTGRFAMTGAARLSGDDPVAIAAGDFNADGALDLAVVNQRTRDVSLLLNDTHGAFVESAVVPLSHLPAPVVDTSDHHEDGDGHHAGDWKDGEGHDGDHGIDRDDHDDRAHGDDHDHDHDGDHGHDQPVIACVQPAGLTTGDFNGDGQIDLAIACQGSDVLALMNGTGGAGFTLSAVPLTRGTGPAAVSSADLNGDGRIDLAVADQSAHRVSMLLNGGTDAAGLPQFTETDAPTRIGSAPLAIAAGDLDGDGTSDLATANHGTDSVSVLLNDGAGGFPSALSVDVPACPQPVAITLGDFTGDGAVDIVVIDQPRLKPLLLTTAPAPAIDHGGHGHHWDRGPDQNHGPDHDHGSGHGPSHGPDHGGVD